jgi:hypothetical protein
MAARSREKQVKSLQVEGGNGDGLRPTPLTSLPSTVVIGKRKRKL